MVIPTDIYFQPVVENTKSLFFQIKICDKIDIDDDDRQTSQISGMNYFLEFSLFFSFFMLEYIKYLVN